jgi:hypothetical protein
MLQKITLEGRPALVAFLNDDFEPVEQSQATVLKAVFTDDAGGVRFMVPDSAPPKKSVSWLRARRRAQAIRAEAEQTLARLRKFDPDQERDEDGKWTSGGGGGGGKLGPEYSDDAKLIDGVIHTSNVYDAVQALHDDRRVELKQPKQVSTLIKKLGEITKDMVDKGEDAPNFDLCKVSIKGTNLFCADTKGIPRIKMPQMDDEQTKEFIQQLKDEGYAVEKGKEKSENLRATQNQLIGAKVAKFYNRIRKDPDFKGDDKRLVVSRDDYVLDGHHHWAAQIAADAKDNKLGDHKTRVFRVDIGIIELLEKALKFTGGKGAKGTDKAFDPSQPRDDDGKWTDGGASGGAAAKPSGKGKKAKKEDFDKAKIRLNVSGGPEGEQKFIDKWNERVGVEPEEFKKQFLGGVDSTMSISGSGSEIEIGGQIQDAGRYVGEYSRRINLDNKSAYSAYFKLEKNATKHDTGKKVLAGNVAMYEQLGVETVGVTANIDVGGYAWAKYGYVPTQAAWDSLRGDLERKLTRGVSSPSRSSSTDTTEAEEWSWIPEDQQNEVRDRWMRDSFDEFLQSEMESWRDSGQALEDAKRTLADDFNVEAMPDWVGTALEKVRDARAADGEPPIPYRNVQLFRALEAADYSSRYSDGRDDVDLSWVDDKLREPEGGPDPSQQTLPGIEPADLSKNLTEEMREQIIDEVTRAFNDRAESDADDIDPPDYLRESVEEYQQQYWDEIEDHQRLEHAQRYGLADIEIERDEEDEEETDEQLDLEPSPPTDPVLDAVRSRDPKSIWKVADSPKGKALLLGTHWSGKLFLKDPEALKRFKDYVGKAKAA